jgi:TRAP-type mannitol/chloroaromatic compound transport system permease small subunit
MSIDDTADLSPGARTLLRVDLAYHKLERLLNFTAGIVILALMLLAVVQVLGRKLFNYPVRGYVDWVEYFMAVFCFLGIAYCQRLGGHVRMELLLGRFEGRTRWILEIVGTLIAIFTITVLAWYAYEHFLRAYEIGDSSMDIGLPVAPGKLVVVIAFISLLLRFAIQLVGFVRLAVHPDAQPIGIPQIPSVEEIAQHEIDVGLAGEEEKVVIVPSAKAEAD